ncbi:MAG: RDD family protein [Asticcacaulis sp.]
MAKTGKPQKEKKPAKSRDLMSGAATVSAVDTPVLRTVITTPEGVRLGFKAADFGTRLGAFLLDYLIMILIPVVMVILYLVLPLPYLMKVENWNGPFVQFLVILFLIMLFFVRCGYFMFFEMGPRAATPGKRVMKIRVIAHDGGHLTPSMVVTRNVMREIEFYMPLTLAGAISNGGGSGWAILVALMWTLGVALLPLFNKQQARLGDFLGGTRVVHVPREVLSYDLVNLENERKVGIIFTPEQVAAYGEKELQVLETVLRERRPATLTAVAERIRKRIEYNMPSDAKDIAPDETFLKAYYAALRTHLEHRMLLGQRRKDKFDETR